MINNTCVRLTRLVGQYSLFHEGQIKLHEKDTEGFMLGIQSFMKDTGGTIRVTGGFKGLWRFYKRH